MEIRAGGARLTLGTFATVEQAWCLGQSAFYQQKKAERRAEKEAIRARKPFIEAWEAGPTTIGRNNERWADLVLTEPSELSGSDFEFFNFYMYCIRLIIVLVVVLKYILVVYLILFSIICMQNLILGLYLQRSREALFPRVRKPRDAPASKKVKTDPVLKMFLLLSIEVNNTSIPPCTRLEYFNVQADTSSFIIKWLAPMAFKFAT
jgi:hypothetical protein